MGIFRQERMYRSDTGQVYKLRNMKASHLINVIGHHQRQLDTLERIYKDYTGDLGYLNARWADMEDTIEVLTLELIERNPNHDDRRQDRRDF